MTVQQTSPLRLARVAAGLTQVEAAVAIGISERTLIRWETDENPARLPHQSICRMVDEYGKRIPRGLTVDQLLGRTPLPEAPNGTPAA